MLSFSFYSPFSPSSRGSLVPCFLPLGWYHLHTSGYSYLLAILIPACDLSILAFCMMYSVYKLNKQGNNIQPWCTPFPSLSQSFIPCPVLSVASWPAYCNLRRQVRWSGIPNNNFKNFPQFVVIHTLSIINEAIDFFFLQLVCFFYDPTDICNLISCSCACSTPRSPCTIGRTQFR